MTTDVWGLLPKAQDNAQTIDEAIASAIADHEADPVAHLGAGESIEVHRQNTILDHPEGSVVPDKFQTGGLSLTYTFDDITMLVTKGDIERVGWPGVTLYPTFGSPVRAYLSSLGSNVRPFVNYNYDFMVQFAFFLAEEGTPTALFQFGNVPEAAMTYGISLILSPSWDKVYWKKNGAEVYSDDLSISRANWHTFRMRYSVLEELLYCYLDGELVATLTEPNSEKLTGGPDWQVRDTDNGNGENILMLEYITLARGE